MPKNIGYKGSLPLPPSGLTRISDRVFETTRGERLGHPVPLFAIYEKSLIKQHSALGALGRYRAR